MIDSKELARALQGAGELCASVEQFFMSNYGEAADLRYQRVRYQSALGKFAEAFPDAKRLSIARAPGRVNIIGEHCDYNGLPVFPMAIERDIVVLLCSRKDQRVNLVNTSFFFPPRSFDIARSIRPYAYGDWGNYAKAAAQALQQVSSTPLMGMDACVMGDIPFGAGLSSSSAMVVAMAVALIAANDLSFDLVELSTLLARGENYVGTEGGGMDQTVSICAKPGSALKIDFFPIAPHPVKLPSDCSFVVCNSLVAAEKSGAARDAFNRRVIECRLGAVLMSESMSGRIGKQLLRVGDIRHLPAQEQMAAIDALPDGGVALREVSRLSGISTSKLRETVLKLKTGEIFPEPADGFQIKKRVRHTLTEGRRVELAAAAMEAGDIERFGELLNESHTSCAEDYEISTPELNTLVGYCREAGAIGARLTGAGFGGCAVAMIRDRDIGDFMSTIIARYYNDYLPRERKGAPVSVMALEDAVFPCKPCGGAATLRQVLP